MSKLFAAFLALALPISVMAAPSAIRLGYLTDHPVDQTSSLTVEIEQHRDRGVTTSSARQEIQATLNIPGSSNQVVKSLPVNLTVDLQALKVGSNAGGHTIAFDSNRPGESPFLAEVSKLIGRSVTFSVDEDLQIGVESPEFVRFLRQLEQIGGFRAGGLFSQVLQNLFALAGQNLQVGTEVTRQFALGGDQDVSMNVVYRVADITDKEVRAVVSGGFDAVEIEQAGFGGPQGDAQVALSLEGRVEGKATWSRKNALVYRTRIDYIYNGVLTVNGVETPLEVRLRHEDQSKAI